MKARRRYWRQPQWEPQGRGSKLLLGLPGAATWGSVECNSCDKLELLIDAISDFDSTLLSNFLANSYTEAVNTARPCVATMRINSSLELPR